MSRVKSKSTVFYSYKINYPPINGQITTCHPASPYYPPYVISFQHLIVGILQRVTAKYRPSPGQEGLTLYHQPTGSWTHPRFQKSQKNDSTLNLLGCQILLNKIRCHLLDGVSYYIRAYRSFIDLSMTHLCDSISAYATMKIYLWRSCTFCIPQLPRSHVYSSTNQALTRTMHNVLELFKWRVVYSL